MVCTLFVQDGQLLTVPTSPAGSSGIAFFQATPASLTLQQLLLQHSSAAGPAPGADATSPAPVPAALDSSSQQLQVPELPDLLFGYLPGSLTPDYVNTDLALVHVAVLQLHGGGSVLGVRMSHLLGDWTSLRLLLRSIAAAYTNAAQHSGHPSVAQARLWELPATAAPPKAASSSAAQQQQQQQRAQLVLPALVPAAPLLNSLATAVLKKQQQQQQQQQQQEEGETGYSPLRLKPLTQTDRDMFAKLAALSSNDGSSGSSQRPVRLSYFVPQGRVQQLKQQLSAEAAGDAGSSNGSSSSAGGGWCSAHNVLLAAVVQAFIGLPGRQGLPHDVSTAADMRSRLPVQQVQLGEQEQQQLAQDLQCAVGNFFASAIAEDCVAQQCSNSELALALHSAVSRCVTGGGSGQNATCTPLYVGGKQLGGQNTTGTPLYGG
jgi:hypothetical protein